MSRYRKSITAVVTVILTWGPLAQDNGVNRDEWWALAVGLAGALGVFAVSNEPKPWTPQHKEGGYADVVSIIAIVILLLILCRIFGLL